VKLPVFKHFIKKKICLFHKLGYFFSVPGFFLLVLAMNTANSYDKRSSHRDNQQEVKSAFILNLARFVEWPKKSKSDKKKDVVICFYQYNFLGKSADSIESKKINGKPVKLKISYEFLVDDACKIVLIPASALPLFLKYNDDKNLNKKITITDLSDNDADEELEAAQLTSLSLENKIIFRLKQENLRLRFEVNKVASKRFGIAIGSELLKLGILVEDKNMSLQRD